MMEVEKLKIGPEQPQENLDVVNLELKKSVKRSRNNPFGNTKMLINEDGYVFLVETHYLKKRQVLKDRMLKQLLDDIETIIT